MRQDAVAELVRKDAVAELEDPKPGIQVSLLSNCSPYCATCRQELRSENVQLVVAQPSELENGFEIRDVVLICKSCDGEAVRFQIKIRFG